MIFVSLNSHILGCHTFPHLYRYTSAFSCQLSAISSEKELRRYNSLQYFSFHISTSPQAHISISFPESHIPTFAKRHIDAVTHFHIFPRISYSHIHHRCHISGAPHFHILDLFSKSGNRNIKLLAVFGYCASRYVVSFFLQDFCKTIVGQRFAFVFGADDIGENAFYLA